MAKAGKYRRTSKEGQIKVRFNAKEMNRKSNTKGNILGPVSETTHSDVKEMSLYNNPDYATVSSAHIDSPPNPIPKKPNMEKTKQLVNSYISDFLDNVQDSLKETTQVDFLAVEFDRGIILQLSFFDNKKYATFDSHPNHKAELLKASDLTCAFDALDVNLGDFLDEETKRNLTEAVSSKRPYFTGTVSFYDQNKSKIYLVKENKQTEWNLEAAQNDIRRMEKDISQIKCSMTKH